MDEMQYHFYFPCWRYHLLQHNLKVTHVERNVCSPIAHLLHIERKSKDTLNARKDLLKNAYYNALH